MLTTTLVILFSIGLILYLRAAFHKLEQWERIAVFSRLTTRKYKCRRGPGLFVFVEPISNFVRGPVSIKDEVTPIKVKAITRDNVEVECEGLLVTRVADRDEIFGKLFTEIEDIESALNTAAHAVFSAVIGRSDLDQLLHSPDEVAKELLGKLNEIIGKWGIEVQEFRMSQPDILDEEVEKALGFAAAQLMRAKTQEEVAHRLARASEAYKNPVTRWLKETEVTLEAVQGPNNVILIPHSFGQTALPLALSRGLESKTSPGKSEEEIAAK